VSGKESFPKNDLVPIKFFPDFEILDRAAFDPRSWGRADISKSGNEDSFPKYITEIGNLVAIHRYIPRKRATFYRKIISGETNLETLEEIDQGFHKLIQEYLSSDECSIICRTCEGKKFFTIFAAGYSLDFLRLVFGYTIPKKDVINFIYDIHEFKNVDEYICHFRVKNFVVYINFSHLSDLIEPDDTYINPKKSIEKTLEFIECA